jgi:hypothetical protein
MSIPAEPGRTDWEAIDAKLMAECGYKPWELDRLTLSEISLLLQDRSKPRPPHGARSMTTQEMQEEQARHRNMTLLERLHEAKEGRL